MWCDRAARGASIFTQAGKACPPENLGAGVASTGIDQHTEAGAGRPSVLARYYALPAPARLSLRWVLIATGTAIAFRDTIVDIARTATVGVLGGYVWVVPAAAILASIGVARRDRTELPIHDRQTDIIVGAMGFGLAILIKAVLIERFVDYFHLLRLDLLAMWLFVVSSAVILFGLRPVIRFRHVWALLLMVFSLPYYLLFVLLGGGKFAAGAVTLSIAGVGTGIAVGRTVRRGVIGGISAWVVGFVSLFFISRAFPDAPVLVYQEVPVLISITVVGVSMYLQARRGQPKTVFDRKIAPLAAKQVWAAVPLFLAVTVVLAVRPLPAADIQSVVGRSAPGQLQFGQPLAAPPGWYPLAPRRFGGMSRFYGAGAVLLRQQMIAVEGDSRFDRDARPRTVVVDSIVSARPSTFNVFPSRVLYNTDQARVSVPRPLDLGYGVTGQLVSVVDDRLLVTWNAVEFTWGDTRIAQRVILSAVDNHEPDAPFPEPSTTMVSTLQTMFTLLIRGNAVLDARAPMFKDADLLTEFGRALVARQFASAS